MKDLRLIMFVTAMLIGGSAIQVMAQNSQARTSSARAAYGVTSEPAKKIKKKKKEHKRRQAKAVREKELANRKRNNWAG